MTTAVVTPQRASHPTRAQHVPRLIFASASDRLGAEFVKMLTPAFINHFKTDCKILTTRKILNDPDGIARVCEAETVPLQDTAFLAYSAAATEPYRVTFHPERSDAPCWNIVIGPHITRHGEFDRELACTVAHQLLNHFYGNIYGPADRGMPTD